jgi:hypothetical protein
MMVNEKEAKVKSVEETNKSKAAVIKEAVQYMYGM